MELERKIFICECNSLEHQYSFWYDEEDNNIWFEPHLYDGTKPWYKKIINKINYVFGHKTRFGAFDEVLLKNSDLIKLKKFFSKVEEIEIDRVVNRARD